MPKMIGVFGYDASADETSLLLKTIDPLSLLRTKYINLIGGFMAVSSLPDPPLKGDRYFEQGDDTLLFSGDLIGFPSIPWNKIINIIERKQYGELKEFHGNFAIAGYNKREKKITLISDRRAQHPLYYQIIEHGFVFSTELSSFCRFSDPASFNDKWLYDYFFFNHSMFQTTFLKNVYKVPAASVFTYHIEQSDKSVITYSEIFNRKSVLFKEPQSYRLAAEVFRNRVPQYFAGSNEIACALTGGWDGRTMVSLCPKEKNILTYTYGVPGCPDLIGGAETAKKAGLKHMKIGFDQNFVRKLPEHMFETVFLSSGSEKILRSTLLYVYKSLTNSSRDYALTISGIGLDGVFKGHAGVPWIVSQDLASMFKNETTEVNHSFWGSVFTSDYSEFKRYIDDRIFELQKRFGSIESPEHHLLYKLYLTHPEHFGGELKIAENFSTLRVPTWDTRILNLAFSIRESALSFSEFTQNKRGCRAQIKLQAFLLNEFSTRLARIPIRNTRPDVATQNRAIYELYRIYRGILNRINYLSLSHEPLEDWNQWLNVTHKHFIDELIFSKYSRIREYITDDFLSQLRRKRDLHWIGKIVTAELILRLVQNRWHPLTV